MIRSDVVSAGFKFLYAGFRMLKFSLLCKLIPKYFAAGDCLIGSLFKVRDVSKKA